MKKARGIACLLVLAMGLSVVGCGGEKVVFDERLVGAWRLAEETHRGATEFSLPDELYFLHDGRFYNAGDGLFSYWDAAESGLDLPRISAEDGTTDIIVQTLLFTQELLEASTLVEVPTLDVAQFPIETAYVLEDIRDSASKARDGQTGNYFAKYADDKLTLTITGSYPSRDMGMVQVDSVLVYERDFPIVANAEYFRPALVGDWKDNAGRQWQFFFEAESQSVSGFRVTVTDADGVVHNSADMRTVGADMWDKDCREWIAFRFADWELAGSVVRFDGKVLVLQDETGAEWTLTRK